MSGDSCSTSNPLARSKCKRDRAPDGREQTARSVRCRFDGDRLTRVVEMQRAEQVGFALQVRELLPLDAAQAGADEVLVPARDAVEAAAGSLVAVDGMRSDQGHAPVGRLFDDAERRHQPAAVVELAAGDASPDGPQRLLAAKCLNVPVEQVDLGLAGSRHDQQKDKCLHGVV
jgi:hypothetical protein